MILTEILNSDENQYGGTTVPSVKKPIKSKHKKLTLDIPGFTAIVYDAVIVKGEKKKTKSASGKKSTKKTSSKKAGSKKGHSKSKSSV